MDEKNLGVTLVELLIVISVLIILAVMTIQAFGLFQKESDLNNSAQELINALRVAQNKTLASEGASQYGVYFNNSTSPCQYAIFKGSSYAQRDASFDEIHKLPKSAEFYGINLGGGSEVVFDRVIGSTNQSGNLSIRLKNDLTKIRSVYIENSGRVGLTTGPAPSNARIKDSRHVHFDYGRTISTSVESLILTFTYDASTVIEQIPIADNMKDGQIYWEGEVNVGGQPEKLKIHTHRLNDPVLGTQFCVHRDRRYNHKALKIDISGDGGISPNLIYYSADGMTTQKGSSIQVSEPQWQ